MKGDKRCCVQCKPLFCNCGCGEFCPETDRHQFEGIAKPYRLGCLKCTTCANQLYVKTAVVFNSAVYCEKCAETAKQNTVDQSQPCARCNQKITGSALLALGKQWCADCFTCSNEECKIKLSGKFFDIDGMPYCKDCNVQAPKKPKPPPPASSPPDAALPASPDGDGGDPSKLAVIETAQEYAEVDDDAGYADVDHNPTTEVEIERDYDNADFSGSTPAPILGRDYKSAAPASTAEYHSPASIPAGSADDTYDNAEAGAPPPEDGTYDNAEAGAPPPSDDTYDNAEAGAPSSDGTYDNADFAGLPPPPDDDTYDNAEHGGPVDVDAIVQQKLSEKMAEIERKVRDQVEAEMKQKLAAEAAAEAPTAAPPTAPPPTSVPESDPQPPAETPSLTVPTPRSKAHTMSGDADPLKHKPNPMYVSAAAPAESTPAGGAEKALLSTWMTGAPEPAVTPSKKYQAKRELPKPRTQSMKPSAKK